MDEIQKGIHAAYNKLWDAYYNKSTEEELRNAVSCAMADLDDVMIGGRNDD